MQDMTIQEAIALIKQNPKNLAKMEVKDRTIEVCQAAVDADAKMVMYVPIKLRGELRAAKEQAKAQSSLTLASLMSDLVSISSEDPLADMELSLS